jgi:hypothetical protein
MTRPRLRGRRNFDVTGRVFRKPKIPADEQGVRNAIHLVLTPILLFVGWAFLSSALVESAGPSGGIGGMLVAVGGLLTIPLGVAVGWHYRHRSMRHLIVTPVVLFFGWRFFATLHLWATGQLPDRTGIVVLRLSALLIIPLGVAVGWRYRQRSLRVTQRPSCPMRTGPPRSAATLLQSRNSPRPSRT